MQADLAAALGIGMSALGITPQQAPAAVFAEIASPSARVEVIQTGSGVTALAGDLVTVHFVVKTLEGKELANTVKRGMPYTVELGSGSTLWITAVAGLRAGGIAKLRANTALFFGKGGVLPIVPPDTMIEAELTLVRIQKGALAKKEPKT